MRYFAAIVACLLTLLVTLPAPAEDLAPEEMVEGFVTGRGYRFHNNQWWQNGIAYTRAWVQSGGYWYCGRYYPQYNVVYTPVQQTTVNVYSDSFETELGKAIAYNQKYQGRIGLLRAAVDGGAISRSQAYSLAGGAYSNGYAVSGGNTVYTYSNRQDAYGQVALDINGWQQTQGRLQLNLQEVTGQNLGKLNENIQIAVDGKVEVDKINAARDAIVAALNSPSKLTTQSQTSIQGPAANSQPVQAQADVHPQVQFADVFNNACGKCHSGAQPKGKFDYGVWSRLNKDDRIKIFRQQLLGESPDPAKRMPQTQDGKWAPLSQSEKIRFMAEAFAQ